jgi:hypothetical protein
MEERFIVVASFTAPLAAQRALQELEEAGVQAFLSGEMTANAFAGMSMLGPQLTLLAARTDRKRALDVLSVLHRAVPDDWEDSVDVEEGVWLCPLCGSAVDEQENQCPSCSTPRFGDEDEGV